MKKKDKWKEVVLVGRIYESTVREGQQMANYETEENEKTREEMGKFLLTIPKDLRRELKFESDEMGFGNASAYICHILRNRKDFDFTEND